MGASWAPWVHLGDVRRAYPGSCDNRKYLQTFPNVPSGWGEITPAENLSLNPELGPRPNFFLSLQRPKRHLISVLLVQRYQIFLAIPFWVIPLKMEVRCMCGGRRMWVCVSGVGKGLTHWFQDFSGRLKSGRWGSYGNRAKVTIIKT